MIFAVLPVKDPRNAKQRLSGFLSDCERENLARAMYEVTIETLVGAKGLDRIIVATSDEATARHARGLGATVLEEQEQFGHSHSADLAARRAKEMGASTVISVPIDVPLVTVADIEALAEAATSGVIIVPSADGTGTNALVRTPPDAIESRFGLNSFQAHVRQAQDRGLTVRVLRLPGLVFDIDTPEDVAELFARAPDSRAARLLRAPCPSKS